jgi:hypothetical protein
MKVENKEKEPPGSIITRDKENCRQADTIKRVLALLQRV